MGGEELGNRYFRWDVVLVLGERCWDIGLEEVLGSSCGDDWGDGVWVRGWGREEV